MPDSHTRGGSPFGQNDRPANRATLPGKRYEATPAAPPPRPRTVYGTACARTEASAGSITGSQHSQHTKRRGMLKFQRFRLQYSYNIYDHPNIEEIAQFIAGLSWQGYASSTISTYVSGIAFIIKSNGLFDITIREFSIQWTWRSKTAYYVCTLSAFSTCAQPSTAQVLNSKSIGFTLSRTGDAALTWA